MSKTRLRVIKKYHDNKNILLGYKVEITYSDNAEDIGRIIEINKEALKRAAKENTVEIENMTLTSDGRLIGKAGKKRKETNKKDATLDDLCDITFDDLASAKVIEVYTNGKNIVGAMIDNEFENYAIPGLNDNITFENGIQFLIDLKANNYENVKIENNKIAGKFRRKAFNIVRNKLLNILNKTGGFMKLALEICGNNNIIITNINENCESTLNNIVLCLIIDSAYLHNAVPIKMVDNNKILIHCNNIDDANDIINDTYKQVGISN